MTIRVQNNHMPTEEASEVSATRQIVNSEQPTTDVSGTSDRKGRGKTVGISVEKRRRKGEKLSIILHPRRKRIVGPNAADFKTEACVIIKQYDGLQHANWKAIPGDIKKKMWLAMKQKFNLGESCEIKKAVDKQFNSQYRGYRHRLHVYYLEHKGNRNIIQEPPQGVNPSDWSHIVTYFESEKFKKISARNRENRAKLTMGQVCGTKSIAQYCFDNRNPETGEEPSRTTVWKMTRFNEQKSSWVDETSHQAYDDIIKYQEEPIEDGLPPMTEDEAFVKALGEEKPNRLRGCGDGLKPPPRRDQHIYEGLERENEELRKQVEEDRTRFDSLEKENRELAAKLVDLESNISTQVQAQVQEILSLQLANIIEKVKQSGQVP